MVARFAKLAPTTVIGTEPSRYAGRLALRWVFDLRLKRADGLPMRVGWLRAIHQAQARVDRGLDIHCPVLLAVSSASGSPDDVPEIADTTDTVLDVEQVLRRAPKLGAHVTVLRIPGGVHDLCLSLDGPRAHYLRAMLAWLDGALGAPK
jgi:alpha-beta hydrolase superfamily lysophospholipase